VKRIIVLFLIVFLVSGCTHGQLPKISFPEPSENKKSLEYQINWKSINKAFPLGKGLDGRRFDLLVRTWAEDEFRESNFFKSTVDVPLGGKFSEVDVVLQITILNEVDPSKFLNTWTMFVNVRRWEPGRLISDRSFVIKDEIHTSPFLIFVPQFLKDDNEEIVRNMFRHLLIQLREQGYV